MEMDVENAKEHSVSIRRIITGITSYVGGMSKVALTLYDGVWVNKIVLKKYWTPPVQVA